jgi:hypothetical protein
MQDETVKFIKEVPRTSEVSLISLPYVSMDPFWKYSS